MSGSPVVPLHPMAFILLRLPWRSVLFPIVLVCTSGLHAQSVSIALAATAAPDSFVVQVQADAPVPSGIPNAVVTLRWRAASGATLSAGDLAPTCAAYSIMPTSVPEELPGYRYATVVLHGVQALGSQCPIGASPQVLFGFKLRNGSGCTAIALADDAFVHALNGAFHFSIGGVDRTGLVDTTVLDDAGCPPCTAPTISGVSASDLPACGQGELSLSVVASGTTPLYIWRKAGDQRPLHYLPNAVLNNATAGVYGVSVTNACGSDSVAVAVAVDPLACVPPEIISLEVTPSPASANHTLAVVATGSCATYQWGTPAGYWYPMPSPQLVVPGTPSGAYAVVVANACGADTLHFLGDTLVGCSAPVIAVLEATAALPCGNSGSELSAVVTGPGPYTFTWTDPDGAVVGDQAEVSLPDAAMGWYALSVSNGCGGVSGQVLLELDSTWDAGCIPPVIGPGGPLGPFCAGDTVVIHADVLANGPCLAYAWSGTGVLDASSATLRAVNGSGPYTLHVANACGADSAVYTVTVVVPLVADTLLCSTDPATTLHLLSGVPEGTVWTLGAETVAEHFDPETQSGGYYTGTQPASGCAVVSLDVQVLAAALWYEDADGDGLGDPLNTLEACDQPVGYVDVDGDACPELFGTIGDPCDDGDPATGDDLITADCICAGTPGIGMAEQSAAGPLLWPNPNAGDGFRVQGTWPAGPVGVVVLDAAGRPVLQRELYPVAGLLEVRMAVPLAAGSYMVQLRERATVRSLRFMVR